MKLKFVVQDINSVDEALRGHYTKGEDGKFYLDVDGAVSKDKLDEFRTNNVELMKKLKDLEGIDPAEYQRLMATERQMRDKKLMDAGKFEELLAERTAEMKKHYEKQIEGLTGEKTSLSTHLEKLLIDNAVATAATKLGVKAEALDMVSLMARQRFRVKDGQAVAMDGDKIVYGKDGSTPESVDEFVSRLSEARPFLFEASSGGGGGGGGKPPAGGARVINGKDPVAFGQNLEAIAKGDVTVTQ